MTLDLALRIAVAAHAGLTDRAGMEPAICHVMRVMVRGTTEAERIVGALHDVVEDSPLTLAYLRGRFPEAIVEAVDAITRREGELYFDYIERCRENPLARAVKVHDLLENIQRGAAYPSLVKRYKKALAAIAISPSETETKP